MHIIGSNPEEKVRSLKDMNLQKRNNLLAIIANFSLKTRSMVESIVILLSLIFGCFSMISSAGRS